MRGGALFKGKEGRGDFRKNSTVGRLHPLSPEFFCPLVRGTEGVLKTIEGRFSKRDTRRSQSRIGQNLYKSVQSVGHEKVKKKSASSARP